MRLLYHQWIDCFQSSKRTLRSNEIELPCSGLLDTELELTFSLQVREYYVFMRNIWSDLSNRKFFPQMEGYQRIHCNHATVLRNFSCFPIPHLEFQPSFHLLAVPTFFKARGQPASHNAPTTKKVQKSHDSRLQDLSNRHHQHVSGKQEGIILFITGQSFGKAESI